MSLLPRLIRGVAYVRVGNEMNKWECRHNGPVSTVRFRLKYQEG